MKKIILFIVLLVQAANAQTGEKTSLLQLQNNITQIKTQTKTGQIDFLNAPKLTKKNPGIAVCLSLLLPGMGELYAGSFESGKYFTIADALLWGTVVGMNSYGNWKRDNYKSFAQTYGGISVEGKDEDYFANLGDYKSVDDYNREMDLQRDYSKVYNGIKYYWNWGSDARRKEYRDMWRSSEQAFNNIRFAVGALILNRIVSVVNAVRLVAAHNKEVAKQESLDVSFSPNYLENMAVGISLNIKTSF
jgi:hypothetical protein